MPLLLMESDGVTNCSQKLLHVARPICTFFAKLLQLLMQTSSPATHASLADIGARRISFTGEGK